MSITRSSRGHLNGLASERLSSENWVIRALKIHAQGECTCTYFH